MRAAATTCGLVGTACAASEECCPGSVCRAPAGGGPNRCRCRYRRTECNGKCWVLTTSERNCGACGNRCPAGVTCENGRCGGSCTKDGDCGTGERCCGGTCHTTCGTGTCVDFATDRNHCGACGNACGAGRACCGGSCRDACPAGKAFDEATCACAPAPRDDHFVVAPGRVCAETPLEPNNRGRTQCATAMLNVQANDPSGHLHFDLDALPAHGKIAMFDGTLDRQNFPLGGFVYTPDVGFIGVDTFGYLLCSFGLPKACGRATVTVTVDPDAPNKPPVAAADSSGIDVLANDHDPDGDPLRVVSVFPGWGAPLPDGTNWFYYRVIDGRGGMDTGVVTITGGGQAASGANEGGPAVNGVIEVEDPAASGVIEVPGPAASGANEGGSRDRRERTRPGRRRSRRSGDGGR